MFDFSPSHKRIIAECKMENPLIPKYGGGRGGYMPDFVRISVLLLMQVLFILLYYKES